MRVRAPKVSRLMARRSRRTETEAARYVRHLGEGRVGFPQGRSGPGGGVFITSDEQVALYLLALAASPTALDCAEVVQRYRVLAADIQRGPALDDPELQDLPEALRFLMEPRHTLLSALTRLIAAARTAAGREALALMFDVRVYRDEVFPHATIVSRLSRVPFEVSYIPAETFEGDFSRFAGHEQPEVDFDFPCVFSARTVCDLGELLEREGASPALADEAPSSTMSRRRANAGTHNGRQPRANGAGPDLPAGQCMTTGARIPANTPGGSPPPSPAPDDEVSRHGSMQPAGADPPPPRLRRERGRAPA